MSGESFGQDFQAPDYSNQQRHLNFNSKVANVNKVQPHARNTTGPTQNNLVSDDYDPTSSFQEGQRRPLVPDASNALTAQQTISSGLNQDEARTQIDYGNHNTINAMAPQEYMNRPATQNQPGKRFETSIKGEDFYKMNIDRIDANSSSGSEVMTYQEFVQMKVVNKSNRSSPSKKVKTGRSSSHSTGRYKDKNNLQSTGTLQQQIPLINQQSIKPNLKPNNASQPDYQNVAQEANTPFPTLVPHQGESSNVNGQSNSNQTINPFNLKQTSSGAQLDSYKGEVVDNDTPRFSESDEEQTNQQIYRRREANYEDSDSNYEDDLDDEEDEDKISLSKLNLLKSREAKLQKEIQLQRSLIQTEIQKAALGANSDVDVKPNKRFKNFNDVFSGLTKSMNVVTMWPIVSVMITYNSKHAITVTKKNDEEYFVKQYSLANYQLTFEEQIGGHPDDYIKLKEVEQNADGDFFAIAYINDGYFKLRTFGNQTRTQQEIAEEELDINKELNLDNHNIPIDNFPDPFITCTFINEEFIYVNLYHQCTTTHYSFIYNYQTKDVTSKLVIPMKNSTSQNFPYKSFYNSEENEIYTFYRQGHSFRVPVKEVNINDTQGEVNISSRSMFRRPKKPYIFQRIIEKDLGHMYLINEKALVARSSSQVLFFKIVLDQFTKKRQWHNYYTLNIRGMIYFIKGNKRIQVTTDSRIYFYLINPETFMPELENVMYNFMGCTQMMFGSRVRYGITYKTNQKSFDVWQRQCEHDFRTTLVEDNYDGSIGVGVESMNAFLVSKHSEIKFYDVDTFREVEECKITIQLLKSQTRERTEIIGVALSKAEDQLAVISGKKLAKSMQKPNQLFIFNRVKNVNPIKMDLFQQIKRVIIKDIGGFDKFSMQFKFKQASNHLPNFSTLIFAKQDKIFEFNYETEVVNEICTYTYPLNRQPQHFAQNHDQSISIIASQDDGLYYNHRTHEMVDLDQLFKISNIKNLIHDEESQSFYMLCNKYEGRLGMFLVKFNEKNPTKFKFFVKWKNKLEIDDANVHIIKNKQKKYKELLVSYKTIYMNTYTVKVVDISRKEHEPIFKHSSFQLWESKITGFYLNKNKDYVIINKDGVSLITLGTQHKRCITAVNGQEKMIHSLESTNYLSIDKSNFINMDFASDQKIISIMQQFTKSNEKTGEETEYETVYGVRIFDITLRELLLLQSLYVCKTQSDILQLVQEQPNPGVFYKSFLELDGTNMVSILSFDSRSMRSLLDDKNKGFFQAQFPIFYRNKIQKQNNKSKYFYRTAIDSALRNNQLKAVSFIIDYLVKYQNHHITSYMFKKNMGELLSKGIEISELLNAQIFSYNFDFDEWPSSHTNDQFYNRPYNGSIFDLRYNYSSVFPEKEFEELDELAEEAADTRKVFKIAYKINMLPMICEYIEEVDGVKKFVNDNESFIDAVLECEQFSIFESNDFIDLMNFKWSQYARNVHMVGFFAHCVYVVFLMIFINEVYIHNINDPATRRFFQILLIIGITYPACYDFTQFYREGVRSYLSDITNYFDMIYIWSSIVNVILQNMNLTFSIGTKICMTIIVLQMIFKTFFFLRIFEGLSYIVSMLANVIYDLRIFFTFYFIMIVFFSQCLAVLGLANINIPGDFQDWANEVDQMDPKDQPEDYPDEEYQLIGYWFGYLFSVLRYSLGDFDFMSSEFLSQEENFVFWFVWFIIVLINCIIFLNFIIAEASNSYAVVKERLDAYKNQAKSNMIREAEGMYFERYKTAQLFPKYIIIREVEQ